MNKIILTGMLFTLLSACQIIGPIFVEYNGVRMDVAQWINSQSLLSMQQKRTLAQLSRAQQRLVPIDRITEDQKLEISQQNTVAMHCAHKNLSDKKIEQLQDKIFDPAEKERILQKFNQEFPKIKLSLQAIQCE